MLPLSERCKPLKQSGIRSATVQCQELGGINLGQGVCDIPIPDAIKQAAELAMTENRNTYSACEGVYKLRSKLADKISSFNHIEIQPETELMITHGSTGAFVCAVQALFNPGDEAILFSPFYSYHQSILQLNHVVTHDVAIDLEDFSIDFNAVEALMNERTRAIIICTPCNPCGKVFSKSELGHIAMLAKKHNIAIITDEIYEYFTYPGYEHCSIASLDDAKDRTLTISGFSKTYNMTGWRLGYVSGPSYIIERMSLLADLLYVCPVTPLQHALLAALDLPDSYYQEMQQGYLRKRDMIVSALNSLHIRTLLPQGAYYLLADISALPFENSIQFVNEMLTKAKVAAVAGSAFFSDPEQGKNWVRFTFSLADERIEQALHQIQSWIKV